MATEHLCSIDRCLKPVFARGWCTKHYNRWRTNGDPLAVKKTAYAEAITFFRDVVLNYTGDDCLIWPYKKTGTGYGQVAVDRETRLVHRLVCEEVNGPPPSPEHESAHSCGRGHDGCCARKHLRWATPIENAADRLLHGTHGRGELSGMAKLTEADVRQIYERRGQESQRKTAVAFGVSQAHIWRIQHAISWAHLTKQF